MKTINFFKAIVLIACVLNINVGFSQENEYTQRFLDLRAKINDPANGYFSADGVPYHSVESLLCEAPDHGHETTSEAYSYWIWLEAMYGGISGDWLPLNNAWSKMEQYAIPTAELQPTTGDYNPASPATYAGENPLPDYYPSPLLSDVPVGQDPVSAELTSAYGSNIYGMHWLFDCDNIYGYGNKGDGVSTPSYINTFQRGEQESVWETVPHPSWEVFNWGSNDGTGFPTLFIDENGNAPAAQWRYTNAPDADARVVQAMYWASEFAKAQGVTPSSVLPMDNASKMGDFVRLAMFDKYFKPIGCQSLSAAGATDYSSAHYLISWYYAWGGPTVPQGWAWRIGSSHNHFGYQNPVAAWALSEYSELIPSSPNGQRDWATSLDRQLEFYTWLQSAEGAIAGGATNSYNGVYDAYPSGTATFYGMAYDEHPVYHDPGSNQWFGMQAWSMERIAELYYITGDSRAEALLSKWVPWVESQVHLIGDDNFEIPSTQVWSGQPNTWNPSSPAANTNLHVTVTEWGQDVGITGCLAKTLTYYAKGTEIHTGTLDDSARELAQQLLDRMWNLFYEEDGKGVAAEETRGDFSRFFEQEVYIPEGWSGLMANGDVIEPGVTFLDIRSFYRDDPDFPALEAAYNSGQDYKQTYHRFWAQVDIALANAEYGRLFGDNTVVDPTGVTISSSTLTIGVDASSTLTATVLPVYASDKSVTWSSSNTSVASVSSTGVVTGVAVGTAVITVATSNGFTATCIVTVSNSIVAVAGVSVSPTSATMEIGETLALTAAVTPSNATNQSVTWTSSNTSVATVSAAGVVTAISAGTATITVTTQDGDFTASAAITVNSETNNCTVISLPFIQDGVGEYCFTTSNDISYVNSWNTAKVTINGVDFTNTWSNSLPAKVNGYYTITYSALYSWAHLELAALKNGKTVSISSFKVEAYPNPFSEETVLTISNPDAVSKVEVFDHSGRLVWSAGESKISASIPFGKGLSNGVYIIKIFSQNGIKTSRIIKR